MFYVCCMNVVCMLYACHMYIYVKPKTESRPHIHGSFLKPLLKFSYFSDFGRSETPKLIKIRTWEWHEAEIGN